MTPEGKVKKEIKQGLDRLGIYYFMPVQTGYGKKSLDFICCMKGKFLSIEAKAGKNKTSLQQDTMMKEIKQAGGLAVVAYSWADVEMFLATHT